MKNRDTKNKIKNLNAQEINRKTLTQSPMRRVGVTFSFNNKLKIKQVVYGLSAFYLFSNPFRIFKERQVIKLWTSCAIWVIYN